KESQLYLYFIKVPWISFVVPDSRINFSICPPHSPQSSKIVVMVKGNCSLILGNSIESFSESLVDEISLFLSLFLHEMTKIESIKSTSGWIFICEFIL